MGGSLIGSQTNHRDLRWFFAAVVLLLTCTTTAAAAPRWRVGEYIITAATPDLKREDVAAATVRSSVRGARVIRSLRSGDYLVGPETAAARIGRASPTIAEYDPSRDNFCERLFQMTGDKFSSCGPNYIVSTRNVPNDSSYSELWGMKGAFGIDAPNAWSLATGSAEVVAAVIDSGVDYNHPDLAANMWRNDGEIPGNGIDDDANGYIDDVHGVNAITGSGNPMDDNSHGTHVAGTIGAVGNNARGVVGVNWNVRIMALKFIGQNGSGSVADAIETINYMVMMKNRGVNIRVSNNSWGGGGFSQSLSAAIGRANAAGIIFVAAAGNEANDNDANASYPASYEIPNVVSVAATDANGNLASFSNYGATSVGIAAPGVGILSTIPGNGYAKYSGTSMASPHVAGALALLLSREPQLAMGDAIARLYLSGRGLPTLEGVVKSGRLLNLGRLISGESAPIAEPPPPSCLYSMAEIGYVPDRAADSAPVVINSDEFGFYTVRLPFQFPFFGEMVSSIVISPNGVVYTKGAPSGMDYTNGATAPAHSIAALHGDLYPVGAGNGVRVATSGDKVTVNWTAPTFTVKSAVATVRLTIYRDGTIEDWIDFGNQEIQTNLSQRSTIGLRAQSSATAVTFARNSELIRAKMGVRFTPQCSGGSGATPSDVVVASMDVAGINGSRLQKRIKRGGSFRLSAYGSGTTSLSLNFTLNGRRCASRSTLPFTNGALSATGKVSSRVRGNQVLRVRAEGHDASARIVIADPAVRSRQRSRSSFRLSKREFTSVCRGLVESLR